MSFTELVIRFPANIDISRVYIPEELLNKKLKRWKIHKVYVPDSYGLGVPTANLVISISNLPIPPTYVIDMSHDMNSSGYQIISPSNNYFENINKSWIDCDCVIPNYIDVQSRFDIPSNPLSPYNGSIIDRIYTIVLYFDFK